MEDTEREALLLNTSEEKLQVWLTDEKTRDQFVIYNGMGIEVYWNSTGKTEPELVDNHGVFTEKFVQWSPLGTYLAATHAPGVSVWGGATFFSPLMRYHHPKVRLIDFSPGEKYLISYSRLEYMLKIFDVKTGELKISFKGSEHDFVAGEIGGVSDVSWPVIRWSGINEDRYFAKMEKKIICIYDSKTFTIINNELMKVENILHFSWSPTDPILALVAANGDGSQPARLSLIDVRGKEELVHKNFINVSDCKIYWQAKGDYLAIMINCLSSSSNTSKYTSFGFLNIKEPGIAIEDLELDNKNDHILAYAWEPKGHRFAVIHHGLGPRPDISFYAMCTTKDRGWASKLITLKGILADSLYWSPVGRFIILAGLKDFSGQLIFYYVDSLETLATEHLLAKDIGWSPTGRYLATSGTLSEDLGTGVKIWSFCGKLLYQIPRNCFRQFLWRPRPPSFMSMQTEEEVFKDLEMTEVPTAFNFQGCDFTKRPEGWDTWWREFIRLGRLALSNGEPTCSAGNQ